MKPRPMYVEVQTDSGGFLYVGVGRQDEPMHQVGPKFKPQERGKAQQIAARLARAFVAEDVGVAPVITIIGAHDLQVALELEIEAEEEMVYDCKPYELDSALFEYLEALRSVAYLDDQIQLDANQALAVTDALGTALETAEDAWDGNDPEDGIVNPEKLREYGRRLQGHGYLPVAVGPALSDYSVVIGTESGGYMIFCKGDLVGAVGRISFIHEFIKKHQSTVPGGPNQRYRPGNPDRQRGSPCEEPRRGPGHAPSLEAAMEVGYLGPGRYRHYKGGEYEVLGVALREDSIDKGSPVESKGEQFVIYRPLTPGSLLERRSEDFWARRLEDFNAMVEREHGPVPRFTRFERGDRVTHAISDESLLSVLHEADGLLSLVGYRHAEKIGRDLADELKASSAHCRLLAAKIGGRI